MWPIDASTATSSPRKRAMVLALAGDSTITSFIAWPVPFFHCLPSGVNCQALALRHMDTISELRGRDLIRKGPFARIWWSQAISSLGDWVTLFASFALAARISGGGRGASS